MKDKKQTRRHNLSANKKITIITVLFITIMFLFSGININNKGMSFGFRAIAYTFSTCSTASKDGYAHGRSTSYSTARTSCYSSSSTSNYAYVGQNRDSSSPYYYHVYRSFLGFDTSGMPDNCSVESATLGLRGYQDYSYTNFYIYVYSWSGGSDGISCSDFNQYGSTLFGSYYTGSWSTSGYNNINLNSNGLSSINKAGYTYFSLRSSRDVNANAPSKLEDVGFYTTDYGTSYCPKLTVVCSPIVDFQEPTPTDNSWTGNWVFVNVSTSYSVSGCTLHWSSSSYAMSGSGTIWYKNMTSLSSNTYSYYVVCTDSGGESGQTETRTVKVDATAPTTSATAVKSTGGSYTFNTWTKSSYVNVSLSCDDGSGSGCGTIQYCTDTTNTCTPTTTYTTPVQISTQGVSYIRYRSVDNVGNTEATKSSTIKIDTTKPVYLGYSSISGYAYSESSTVYWVKGGNTFKIRISHSDEPSGVYIQYFGFNKDDCTPSGCGGAPYEIKSYSYHGDGVIDWMANDSYIDINAVSCVDADANCADDDLTLEWSAYVNSSCLDWDYKLHTYLYDAAYNGVGYTDLGVWVKVDNTVPTVGAPTLYSGTRTGDNSGSYFKGTVSVRAAISDTRSGIASGTCEVSINGGGYTDSGVTQDSSYCYYNNYDPEADFTIAFRVNDNVGNTGTSSTSTFKYDGTPPTTSATAVKSTGGSYTFNTWTKSSYVNVSLSCDDGSGSGCGTIQYCTDTTNTCTPTTTYTTPVQISTQGVSYIRYRSVDNVGNTEATKSSTIKIDTIAPSCSLDSISEGSDFAFVSGVTVYYNNVSSGSFTVGVSASDSGSGVDYVLFPDTVSSGGSDSSSPFSWSYSWDSSDGSNYDPATIYCYDNAGNYGSASFSVVLDVTPPSGGYVSYDDGYSTKNWILVSVDEGSDSQSGISDGSASLQLYVSNTSLSGGVCDGSGWSSWHPFGSQSTSTTQVNVTNLQSGYCYKFMYRVSDNVHNFVYYYSSSVVKVDTNAPNAPPNLIINDTSWSRYKSHNFSWDPSSDQESGVAGYYYDFDNPNPETTSNFTTSLSVVLDCSEGNHTLYVKAKDNAGNIGPASTVSCLVYSEKGIISTTVGATPFYTTSPNPQTPSDVSCLSNLQAGQSCDVSWIVNATGLVNTNYIFFVFINSSFSQVSYSESNETYIEIVSGANSAPSFVGDVNDNSTQESPTNQGDYVVFTANATDPDGDMYRLIVCSSNSTTNGECSDVVICASDFVSSGTQTSCSHDTSLETNYNYSWFAFACDAFGACSSSNYVNSPYYLNRKPIAYNVDISPRPATTSDVLFGFCNYSDADNHLQGNSTYAWYINGSMVKNGSISNVLLLHFDEGSGTNTFDSSFNGNNGTLNGDPQWVDGKFGKALEFDGVDDYVEVVDSASLNITDAITIEAWVKVMSDPFFYGIVVKAGGDNPEVLGQEGFELIFRSTSVGYRFAIRDVNNVSLYAESGPESYGEWTHVVGVYDGSAARIYINGELKGMDEGTVGSYLNNNSLKIGIMDNHYFNGTIDEVRIYNRALSADEIKAIYESGLPHHPNEEYLNTSEFGLGDRIIFECTPCDNTSLCGAPNSSSVLTIGNSPPDKVVLVSPTNGNDTIHQRNTTFTWQSAYDADGDSLTYQIQVSNSSDFSELIINESSISTTTYTSTVYLDLNEWYYWRVRAFDGTEFGNYSDVWNFSIEPVLNITLISNTTDFGELSNNEENDTTDDSPQPFIVRNNGNYEVNISVNASQLWNSVGLGTEYYRFKVGIYNGITSFDYDNSQTTWENFTSQPKEVIRNLNYKSSNNTAEIEIYVKVPNNEGAGSRSSVVEVGT